MTNAIKFTLSLNDAGFATSAKRVEKSLADVGKAGQVSAGQIAAATRGLPAQFTDIATSLAGGQNPFLVLLQQGGQIKDQFGGIGNAIKGIGAAISPVGLIVGTLALAFGSVATAAVLGANEAAKLRDMMVLTGNAAGLTADRVDDLSDAISGASQQTVGEAREIVTSLAASGKAVSGVIESQGRVIGRIADLSGKAGRDIAASFASQLDAPAKFAAKLNEAYNFLTVADFKRIQALERGKKAVEAANVTNALLEKSLEGQRSQLGYAERAWDTLTAAISRTKRALLDVGKPDTIKDAIATQFTKAQELQNRLAQTPESALVRTPKGVQSARAQIQQEINSAQRRIFELQRQADIEATNALARSESAADTRAKIEGLSQTGKPANPLGAIQSGREQYRNDFLRSEKAFYAELEEQDKKLRDLARQDPLGEFIAERVLPESAARAQQRLTQEAGILQSLVDENARAGAELLTNERDRGRAIIEIDRDIGIRRLKQQDLSNEALIAGIVEVNTRADIALKSLNQQIVQKELDSVDSASQSMADSISTGILEGFRRGNSLADIFLQELKAQFAKTVLSPLIKPVVEAGNSGLQALLQNIALGLSGNGISVDAGGAGFNPGAADYATGDIIRGRRAAGGPVRPFSTYLVGEQGPELLRMGAQGGSVVPNSAMGGVNLAPNVSIHIEARSDQAQVSQLVAAGVQQGMRATMEQLRIMGVTR